MVNESTELRATEMRATEARDSVVVAVHDTIMEVTTITYVLRQAQEPNEPEDTVKVTTVTDRLRARERDTIARQRTKTEVRVDTVYVVKRDSVEVSRNGGATEFQSSKTALHRTLKWIFWIIVALTVLVVVMKVGWKRIL